MPYLDVYDYSLLQEKDNISQMGLQRTSNAHALAANEAKKKSRKGFLKNEKVSKSPSFLMRRPPLRKERPGRICLCVPIVERDFTKKKIASIKGFFPTK